MTGFDHSQSPRLGQRLPYEGTTVMMFEGDELPEVSVTGQIIFRTDTSILQVYTGTAWADVTGGVEGTLTYVGDTEPATPPAKLNDLWYDTANGHLLHVHNGTDWDPAPLGIDAIDTTEVNAGALGGTTPETLADDLGGDMTDATITGATIQTSSQPNQGIKLQDGTLKAYPPAGGTAFFDVNPAAGMVIVAGEGTFQSLTAKSSTELGGTTTVPTGSSVQMAAGTQPPGSAPKVDTDYHIFQFEASDAHGYWEYRAGWVTDGTYWYTAENGANFTELMRYDNNGNHAGWGWAQDMYVTCGLTYHSGALYWLVQALDANENRWPDQYFVMKVLPATNFSGTNGTWAWTNSVGTKNPAISHDPATGEICIAQHRTANADKMRIRWYSPPSGSGLVATGTTDTDMVYDYNMAGLVYGITDFAFAGGTQAWTTSTTGTGQFRVVATSSESPTRNWESGMASKVGFTYVSRTPTLTTGAGSATVTGASGTFNPTDYGSQITGTGIPANTYITAYNSSTSVTISNVATSGATAAGTISGWKSMDKTGLMRTYSRLDFDQTVNDPANTRWVSSTHFRDQATDWETPQSNRASILPKKRSRITITTAALPASPGTNDPNQVQIYVGKGATDPGRTAMWRQATPAVGNTSAVYPLLVTSGTNPPSANNFPESSPAKIFSTSKRSDGVNPVVNLPASGRVDLDGLIPPGSIMMWPTNTAPVGWALCNGGTKSRTTDRALYDVIGTTFGPGDGSTTFHLPDMRGRFPLGAGGTVRTNPGAYETSETSTAAAPGQADATRLDHQHSHSVSVSPANMTLASNTTTGGTANRITNGESHSHGGSTSDQQGVGGNKQYHALLTLNFIIKL